VTWAVVVLCAGHGLTVAGLDDGLDGVVLRGGGDTAKPLPVERVS
jgi:hypothetical protein